MDFLGIADEEFIRQDVPMTKQEIRILSLVKAQIAPDAVVYDIGAGTGSISIEAARLARRAGESAGSRCYFNRWQWQQAAPDFGDGDTKIEGHGSAGTQLHYGADADAVH